MFSLSFAARKTSVWTALISQRIQKDVLKCVIFKYCTQAPQVRKKEVSSASVAIQDIQNGAKVLVGGFGLCGIPENLIRTLAESDIKDLTVVSSDVEAEKYGVGMLIKKRKVKRLITSHIGECEDVCDQYGKGELETEFVPQGTLAERMRAGGAGIPAFYTAVGNGTLVQDGDIPIKYNKAGDIEISSEKQEVAMINGKEYVRQESIFGDFALIKAWKGDLAGNLVFSKSARNFNPVMARAAKTTIAEVECLVQIGDLKPDEVHLPGVYVDRIFQGEKYEKRIQKVKLRKEMQDNESVVKKSPAAAKIEKILKRVAKEFKDGMCVNLGVGLPMMVSNHMRRDINVFLQSENGILGLGPYPIANDVDPDLINGAKETVTVIPGASYFASDDSFAMIRGGHVDLTVVGAHQVSQFGDLANWTLSNKPEKGMGATMDMVSVPDTKIVACTEHTNKDGSPKIVDACTLPLTGQKCVDMIITEKCVFNVDRENGLTLVELMEGSTMADVIMSTGCNFQVTEEIKCKPLEEVCSKQ